MSTSTNHVKDMANVKCGKVLQKQIKLKHKEVKYIDTQCHKEYTDKI